MAKKEEAKKSVAPKKVRSDKYEEKVHFGGTLEDMIKMAVKKPLGKKG